MAEQDGGNGRIKQALTERDVEELKESLGELRAEFRELRDEIKGQAIMCAACKPVVDVLREDIQALKARSAVWDSINSVAAVIAAVVGISIHKGP